MKMRFAMRHLMMITAVFAAAMPGSEMLAAEARDVEAHAAEITRQILAEAAKLKAADPEAVPMVFWDFDGTLLKGDVTEGLRENGLVRYPGLTALLIAAGYSADYPAGTDGVARFTADYAVLERIGRYVAWPYNVQIFSGRTEREISEFAAARFADTYRPWFFAASIEMLAALERAEIENYIISGSPELYVRAAAAELGLPSARFRGVRVEIAGGRVTERIVYPITSGEGKIENLRELVLARPHGVAIAGFGNSYSTDGAFLRYIATQPSLPGGARGIAVMINGGEPQPGYSEYFRLVEQTKTAAP